MASADPRTSERSYATNSRLTRDLHLGMSTNSARSTPVDSRDGSPESSRSDSPAAKHTFRSPSKLCESPREFEFWFACFRGRAIDVDHSHPLFDEVFDTSIVNGDFPPPRNRRLDPFYEELSDIFTFTTSGDGSERHDPWKICHNADILCSEYRVFRKLGGFNKASLRGPVHTLLERAFVVHAEMELLLEVPVFLPQVYENVRQALNLAPKSTTVMESVVYQEAALDMHGLTEVDADVLFLGSAIHLLHRRFVGITLDHFPVVQLVTAYEMEEGSAHRKVQMDVLLALLHRRFLGFSERPVHALAVSQDRVRYYHGVWEDDRPTITRYVGCALGIDTLRGWVRLYILLIRIRQEIENTPLGLIPGLEVQGKRDWRLELPESLRAQKRKRSTSPAVSTVTEKKTRGEVGSASGDSPRAMTQDPEAQSEERDANNTASRTRLEPHVADRLVLHSPSPVRPKPDLEAMLGEALSPGDA